MVEIKSILFPTDFSEGSSQALQYAVDMAKRYGAKLYFFHVIHDIFNVTNWYIPHTSMDELYKDIEEGAKKEFDRVAIEELEGLENVEHIILRGVPHQEIIKFAAEKKIDIIVMGTHSRKGIDRILFGSTASQVVRYAPCTVLTVRLPKY